MILAWCEHWNRHARHWSTQEGSKWAQYANCAKISNIFWTQEMPTRWVLGPSKDRTRQSDLRVGSVFHKEYLGLQDLDRKSTKMWIEVAFDLLRVQRCGLKWPSTSWERTKGVQHAKCARITTIYWTQERSPRSRTSRKCTHMNRSKCKIGPHGLRF